MLVPSAPPTQCLAVPPAQATLSTQAHVPPGLSQTRLRLAPKFLQTRASRSHKYPPGTQHQMPSLHELLRQPRRVPRLHQPLSLLVSCGTAEAVVRSGSSAFTCLPAEQHSCISSLPQIFSERPLSSFLFYLVCPLSGVPSRFRTPILYQRALQTWPPVCGFPCFLGRCL